MGTRTTSNGRATWGTRAPGSGISTHPDITPCYSDTILDSRGGTARAPLCADPPRPSSPFRRCRFNPIGRSLSICMAMHYSSNDERAATIVAYPKEGNAALNVRFLRPRHGAPPTALLDRGHCPVGLTRGRSEIRPRKFDVLILHRPFDRTHMNAHAFRASRFSY